MVRALFVLALLAAGFGCGSEPEQAAPEKPGRYARPDFEKLWREMERLPGDDGPSGKGNPVEDMVSGAPEGSAYRALWAAVAKAEEAGLYELYGVERSWPPELGGYDAMFFVRTAGGVSCFHAMGTLHESRADTNTVPSLPVSAERFEKLRTRIGIELPFPLPSAIDSVVYDGVWVLVHAYRDGRSHSALWYSPYGGWLPLREDVARNVNRYPIVAFTGALSAATPSGLYPRYQLPLEGEVPENEKWQYDDAEVYKRLPGHEPR